MAERRATTNGSFELFYRNGWAYLSVRPPAGAGLPVYQEDVENRMRLLGVPRTEAKRIREIIAAADGMPAALVPWPAGSALTAELKAEIAADGMEAFLTAGAPRKGAAPPTVDDALAALAEAGVVSGIDQAAVKKAVDPRAYGKRVRVASGSAPIDGKGRRVRYLFNTNRGKPYLEMDFGRINLRELNFIDNRKAGEALAELEGASAAIDGRTVTGKTLAAKAADADERLLAGANVFLAEDGATLRAACDGNARVADGKVVVEPVVVVKNVNYETGNIRFDGSVVIEGSIADGFSVEATGDVQVANGVGRARIAAGGSLVLKTGINGNGEGRIECGGDLYAKYLESCEALCRGNVFVEEAIMHSKVTAYRSCVLNGRRSEAIASEIVAGGSFWCKKLGNLYEAPTRVQIGVHPDLLSAYRETAEGLLRRQEDWDKTERNVEQLGKLIQDGRADERVTGAWTQLQGALDKLGLEIAELRRRFPELRDRLRASRSSVAVVEEFLFKGAVVQFGTLEYRPPDNGVRRIVLRPGEKDVLESGYNPADKPSVDFGGEA